MQNELSRFLAGCLTIVSRHIEIHCSRQQPALRRVYALEHRMSDLCGVGALALRDGDRDRGLAGACSPLMRDIGRRLAVTLCDISNIAKVYRSSAAHSDD